MAGRVELLGSASCSYTQELRDWLEWTGREFVEFDVAEDRTALERLRTLTGGQCAIPVLIEDGKVIQIGWQGRSCVLAS